MVQVGDRKLTFAEPDGINLFHRDVAIADANIEAFIRQGDAARLRRQICVDANYVAFAEMVQPTHDVVGRDVVGFAEDQNH